MHFTTMVSRSLSSIINEVCKVFQNTLIKKISHFGHYMELMIIGIDLLQEILE